MIVVAAQCSAFEDGARCVNDAVVFHKSVAYCEDHEPRGQVLTPSGDGFAPIQGTDSHDLRELALTAIIMFAFGFLVAYGIFG